MRQNEWMDEWMNEWMNKYDAMGFLMLYYTQDSISVILKKRVTYRRTDKASYRNAWTNLNTYLWIKDYVLVRLRNHREQCKKGNAATPSGRPPCTSCAIDEARILEWDASHRLSTVVKEFNGKSPKARAKELGWKVSDEGTYIIINIYLHDVMCWDALKHVRDTKTQ